MLRLLESRCTVPSYSFNCSCGWSTVKRFTSIPSKDKQRFTVCEECEAVAERDYATDLQSVNVTGGQKGGIERAVGFATEQDSMGRPIYKDVNGRKQEIRTSKDVDKWMTTNSVGVPRMVPYKNPITGEQGFTADRVGGVKLNPQTGEPMDAGAVIRTSEQLIPLDNKGEDFIPPSETRTGNKLNNAGVVNYDPGERSMGIVDPETGKPMKYKDAWGKENAQGFKEAGVRRPPPGKKWS